MVIFKRYNPIGWQDSFMVTNMSETLSTAAVTFPSNWMQLLAEGELIMHEEWWKAWKSGPFRWKPYARGTYFKMGKRGLVNLTDTGALERAVLMTKFDPDMDITPSGLSMKFEIRTEWPEDDGKEYVWFHEFGTERMPRREFMRTALENANRRITAASQGKITQTYLILKSPEKFGITPKKPHPFLGMLGPMAMMTMAIPPIAPFSQILLAWGVSSDVSAAMSGSLFTSGAIRNMILAWGLGSMGLTPRVQRRQARRKMWGSVL